ncbi:hypothetical protein C5S35_02150 [Candidatus Methanophagaceae archaeon]|nr:hypothetical protein C5S35_02150 [Methanophagales archaeon]
MWAAKKEVNVSEKAVMAGKTLTVDL